MSLLFHIIELASTTGIAGYGLYKRQDGLRFVKNQYTRYKNKNTTEETPPQEWSLYLSKSNEALSTIKLAHYGLTVPDDLVLKYPAFTMHMTQNAFQGHIYWNQQSNTYLFRNLNLEDRTLPLLAMGRRRGMVLPCNLDEPMRMGAPYNPHQSSILVLATQTDVSRISDCFEFTTNNETHIISLYKDGQNMLFLSHYTQKIIDQSIIPDHTLVALIAISEDDLSNPLP